MAGIVANTIGDSMLNSRKQADNKMVRVDWALASPIDGGAAGHKFFLLIDVSNESGAWPHKPGSGVRIAQASVRHLQADDTTDHWNTFLCVVTSVGSASGNIAGTCFWVATTSKTNLVSESPGHKTFPDMVDFTVDRATGKLINDASTVVNFSTVKLATPLPTHLASPATVQPEVGDVLLGMFNWPFTGANPATFTDPVAGLHGCTGFIDYIVE